MQQLDTAHKFLSDKSVIESSIFADGLATVARPSNYIERPLSTLFDGCVNGFIYSIGGAIVYDWVPPNLRFIMPILLGLSVVKYWFTSGKRQGPYRLKFKSTRTNLGGETSESTVTMGPNEPEPENEN
jgi:hypothetical protein